MKLSYIKASGFRGFKEPIDVKFSDSFNIIDGRNGVGKSTLFDAVEFALTGSISKYLDAKSGGETVSDYIWWTGDAPLPAERYVEVGFSFHGETQVVRRTPDVGIGDDIGFDFSNLVDLDLAPHDAIQQLCASTIIRDEHIARLSLDISEVNRFKLLRSAIGAVDADVWISKGQRIHSAAGSKVRAAEAELAQENAALQSAVRQIDAVRASLPAESALVEATAQIRSVLRSSLNGDSLKEQAQARIISLSEEIELLTGALEGEPRYRSSLVAKAEAESVLEARRAVFDDAQVELDLHDIVLMSATSSGELSTRAKQLEQLAQVGQHLGRHGDKCPLCASGVTEDQLYEGIEAARSLARAIDSQAAEQARREHERERASDTLRAAADALARASHELEAIRRDISAYEEIVGRLGFAQATHDAIATRLNERQNERAQLTSSLRVLDALGQTHTLLRASENERSIRERIQKAEGKLGKARLAEARAKALHDAARRAAAEIVDQRLDRVLPLMSELYKRLRPHPIWGDIEYSVRGDVNRFLKLQVGDDVNPQFVFSSGQRRATGLAFLLSLNLSLTWNRWNTIMLDDPVQHVDDFRTVHLAEVLAQLCAGGRQIVCAVEDGALADLLCRRLPRTAGGPGRRIRLGSDAQGSLSLCQDQIVEPMRSRTLVNVADSLAV